MTRAILFLAACLLVPDHLEGQSVADRSTPPLKLTSLSAPVLWLPVRTAIPSRTSSPGQLAIRENVGSNHAVTGAVVGGVLGAVLGGWAAHALSDLGCVDYEGLGICGDNRTPKVIIGSVAGALAGAGLGSLLGRLFSLAF